MEKRWQRGDVILSELYTGWRHKLISVFPSIVVEDTAEYLALYHPSGYTFAYSYDDSDIDWASGSRETTPLAEQIAIFLQWEPELFRQRASRSHVLYLMPHDGLHVVWAMWDEDWRLTNWYVNLQAPYVRTEVGVQIEDYYLDLWVEPDFTWRWKDADQFQAFCDAGALDKELERSIRAEGELLGSRIEARQWPFDQPWPDWRPDPSWPIPHIADYWPLGKFPYRLQPS